MRIEAYSQIQQVYQSQKAAKPQTNAKKGFADQLQISSMGKDIQTAKAAVKNAPDIREDIIAPIKEQIQNGSYEVDPASFADKLLSRL